MRNRIVAGVTIFFLVVFDFSCLMYSIKKESPEKAAFRRGPRNEVLAVMKKSKEYVQFSANRRGRIVGDRVVGLARQRIKKELEIPGSQVVRIEKTGENAEEIITTDGKRYRLLRVVASENKYVGEIETDIYQESSVSIPLADIEMVWYWAVDPLKTFLVGLGVVGGIVGIFWGAFVLIVFHGHDWD
jgi:hypothetical protein